MKKVKRTYLLPRHMRLGQPQLVSVCKETIGFISTYWLTTSYGETKFNPAVNGTTNAYSNRSSISITEDFYYAFLKESLANQKRFAKQPQRAAR